MKNYERKILVIADLHLHPGSEPGVVGDFARLITERSDANCCTLVLNGDVFDLDRVAGERRGGEGAYRAMLRLRATLDSFPAFEAALAGWLARGGQIVWLPGNHDAELCLPEVRGELWCRLGPRAAAARFEPHAFEQGTLHIEHGHQHDPDNHFYPDTGSAVAKRRLSAFPLGCLIDRFLLCRLPHYKRDGDNHSTPGRVLMRVIRDYGWATPRMVALYVVAALRIGRIALFTRRLKDADSQSSMNSPFSVLGRMYLDRVALSLAFCVLFILGLAGALGPGGLASPDSQMALGASLPLGALLLLSPSRRRRFRHRDRIGCRRQARQVIEHGKRVVIMGHTHHPERLTFAGGTYINPGAFFRKGPDGQRPWVEIDF